MRKTLPIGHLFCTRCQRIFQILGVGALLLSGILYAPFVGVSGFHFPQPFTRPIWYVYETVQIPSEPGGRYMLGTSLEWDALAMRFFAGLCWILLVSHILYSPLRIVKYGIRSQKHYIWMRRRKYKLALKWGFAVGSVVFVTLLCIPSDHSMPVRVFVALIMLVVIEFGAIVLASLESPRQIK